MKYLPGPKICPRNRSWRSFWIARTDFWGWSSKRCTVGQSGKKIILETETKKETMTNHKHPALQRKLWCTASQTQDKSTVSSKKWHMRLDGVWIWNRRISRCQSVQWHWLMLAHLGGDNAVVGITLRDVSLSSWRRFFMPNVHRPSVHPDLLPYTLTKRQTKMSQTEWKAFKRRTTRIMGHKHVNPWPVWAATERRLGESSRLTQRKRSDYHYQKCWPFAEKLWETRMLQCFKCRYWSQEHNWQTIMFNVSSKVNIGCKKVNETFLWNELNETLHIEMLRITVVKLLFNNRHLAMWSK